MKIRLLVLLAMGVMTSCTNKSISRSEKTLPDFNMLLLDSTKYNSANIPTGKPTILFFFSTECPYCQAFTRDIVANKDKLKGIQLYMLSPMPFRDIKAYDTTFKLNTVENVTVGKDYKGSFSSHYKISAVPYLVVYDKSKNLVKEFTGAQDLDSLKKLVN
jgi:thioredoxin-related protein